MSQLTIQVILWLLLALFVGCIIGYLLHWLLVPEAGATKPAAASAGAGAATAAPVASAPAARARPAPPRDGQSEANAKPNSSTTPASVAKPAAAPKSTAKPKPRRATGKPARPSGLATARGGKADNLQQISGVGPKLEKTLHGLGFFHFSQIAEWNADEAMWVDEHLRYKGRIERDEWIPQAKLLAAGDLDKFAQKYGSGGMRRASGQAKSGKPARRNKKRSG